MREKREGEGTRGRGGQSDGQRRRGRGGREGGGQGKKVLF